jgi:hypothetical protein
VPGNVDLVVARQQHVSKDKVAAAVAQDELDLTNFKSQHFALASLTSSTNHNVASAAPSSLDIPLLLTQIQNALKPEVVATACYSRDIAFAAALCAESSDDAAADGALADAALYAAASKSLCDVVVGLGSPAEALASMLAQAQRALSQTEAAQAAAKTAKDYSKAADLQALK